MKYNYIIIFPLTFDYQSNFHLENQNMFIINNIINGMNNFYLVVKEYVLTKDSIMKHHNHLMNLKKSLHNHHQSLQIQFNEQIEGCIHHYSHQSSGWFRPWHQFWSHKSFEFDYIHHYHPHYPQFRCIYQFERWHHPQFTKCWWHNQQLCSPCRRFRRFSPFVKT